MDDTIEVKHDNLELPLAHQVAVTVLGAVAGMLASRLVGYGYGRVYELRSTKSTAS